jgi:hypothetical protein
MLQEEPLRLTALTINVETEAPYASNVIRSVLEELAQTLDFTGMYEGHIKVTSPTGEVLYGWTLGQPPGDR